MAIRIGRLSFGKTLVIAAGLVLLVLVAGVSLALGSGLDRGGARSSGLAAPTVPGFASEAGPARDAAGGSVAAQKAAPVLGQSADTPDRTSAGEPVVGDRALVRTAQLSVDVADLAAAVRQVRTAVAAAGGYVVAEQTGADGSLVVLRAPVAALDRLVEDVAGYGKVTARSSQVVDATDQVVDLDARVASQQASVDRVRALLARAESIGDIVAIESQLTSREADLDSLKNRLAALRDKVALSTLTVNLTGPGAVPAVEDAAQGGFLGGLATGWAGLRSLGSALGAALGFVIPFLPVLAVLAGIGWLARRILRARRTPSPAPGTPGSADS